MVEEIEGFEDYSTSEKFSNFIYTLFDMMSENTSFIDNTFNKYVFHPGSRSEFHKEVKALFKDFLTSDGNIAVSAGFFMKDYYYSLLASQYLFLINFWRKDDSDGKERTLALSDKLTSLFEEAIYNKTLDKSFDLAKFIFGSIGVGNDIPFIGDCLNDIFGEKEEDKEDDKDE